MTTSDRNPRPYRFLVAPAGTLLALALALALARDGASFGSVLWVVELSIGAMAVVATLTWRPAWLKPLARLAAAGRPRRPGRQGA